MIVPRSDQKVYVYAEPIVTDEDITDAYAVTLNGITFEVNVAFTKQAAERLGKFTEEHFGEMLAVIADGKLLSAPVIRGRISDKAVISGYGTEKEALEIEKLLKPK
jgi:preprotein translocase subunit SecD